MCEKRGDAGRGKNRSKLMLVVAVEAAKQGVTVGEDTASGLKFADDLGGDVRTLEGSQKQVEEKALKYTIISREWRVAAKVKKCAAVLCHKDKVNRYISVGSGEKINYRSSTSIDRYTYLGVDISKYCSWDTDI